MGKFVIKGGKDGKPSFNLVAGNGQVIGRSQQYASLATCKGGIESVRRNSQAHIEDQTVEGYETLKHPKFEIYLDKAGEFRFRLKAANGENILASEGYTAKKSCLNGIESVGKNAPEAEIVKLDE